MSVSCAQGEQFERAAAGGGRVALARVAARIAYRGHWTCLRDGDMRVEGGGSARSAENPRSRCRRPAAVAACALAVAEGQCRKTRSVSRRDSDGTVPAADRLTS
jgi:hypothetical protein